MNTDQQIVIYQKKGIPQIKVKLQEESVWLTQQQMAILFDKNVNTIGGHILNTFKEKELSKKSVTRESRATAEDGKSYRTNHYNLDVIISVGYRVKSLNGTKFRIWATKVLKEHIIKGYTINESRLLEAKNKLSELNSTIAFLQKKSKNELLLDQSSQIIDIISNYSKTLSLLENYDKGNLKQKEGTKTSFTLNYSDSLKIITLLKNELVHKKEASELFGTERQGKMLEGILGNLYQTFNKKELYPNIEIKSANLLYLVIKDHPFSDGNKRIGSFMFIYFLDKNNYLYKNTGERKINDNALTALALLIAISHPSEKEIMINLITNLLNDNND